MGVLSARRTRTKGPVRDAILPPRGGKFVVKLSMAEQSRVERIFEGDRARARTRRARLDPGVPLYLIGAGRLPLPPPAHLLGLCGRGHRAIRPLGRRMDDIGPAMPLPAVWNRRARCRTGCPARAFALVSALALRALAGHQRPRARWSEAGLISPRSPACRGGVPPPSTPIPLPSDTTIAPVPRRG